MERKVWLILVMIREQGWAELLGWILPEIFGFLEAAAILIVQNVLAIFGNLMEPIGPG